MILSILALMVGIVRADFCYPNTCSTTATPTSTATATRTNTAAGTNTFTQTATQTATSAPTQWSVSGQVTCQAGSALVGFGDPGIITQGYQIAGAGGGGATLASYVPIASGLFCVRVGISTGVGDTVTVNVTYTDTKNNTSQTRAIINGNVYGANATDSASAYVDAKIGVAITVKLVSAATTFGGASILPDKNP